MGDEAAAAAAAAADGVKEEDGGGGGDGVIEVPASRLRRFRGHAVSRQVGTRRRGHD